MNTLDTATIIPKNVDKVGQKPKQLPFNQRSSSYFNKEYEKVKAQPTIK